MRISRASPARRHDESVGSPRVNLPVKPPPEGQIFKNSITDNKVKANHSSLLRHTWFPRCHLTLKHLLSLFSIILPLPPSPQYNFSCAFTTRYLCKEKKSSTIKRQTCRVANSVQFCEIRRPPLPKTLSQKQMCPAGHRAKRGNLSRTIKKNHKKPQ